MLMDYGEALSQLQNKGIIFPQLISFWDRGTGGLEKP